MLEQIAQERNAAEQRHLCDSYAVLGLDDAANHNRAAIGDQDLRGGLLLCSASGSIVDRTLG